MVAWKGNFWEWGSLSQTSGSTGSWSCRFGNGYFENILRRQMCLYFIQEVSHSDVEKVVTGMGGLVCLRLSQALRGETVRGEEMEGRGDVRQRRPTLALSRCSFPRHSSVALPALPLRSSQPWILLTPPPSSLLTSSQHWTLFITLFLKNLFAWLGSLPALLAVGSSPPAFVPPSPKM